MVEERRPNPEQQAAIDFRQGPLRIIAGAGSGKSTTLVDSAVSLVRAGVQPNQILALTFTDAAAEELRQKMQVAIRELDANAEIDVDTYNAFGGRIVIEHAHLLNLPPQPRVLTPGEGTILLWRSIEQVTFRSLDLTWMRSGVYGSSSVISTVLNISSRLADEDREIDEYHDWALEQDEESMLDALDRVAMLEQYERSKAAAGAIDFADQIRLACEVLAEPEVRATYGQRYRYIMVDEYQDTNYAQRVMVRYLGSAVDQNVRVVGDPYQAIYGFRGAAPDNLDRFADTDFPTTTTITLGTNYRSTQPILDLANALWDDAPDANGTVLVTPDGKVVGTRPVIVEAATITDEIAWLANDLQFRNESGTAWSKMVILVRKNAQKKRYARMLAERGIPIEAVGGASLFESDVTRLMISMLRVLVDATDDPSLAHLLGSDRWGVDDAALFEVGRLRDARTESLFVAAERFAEDIGNPLAEQVRDCVSVIRGIAQRSRTQTLHATVDDIQRALFSTLDDVERDTINRFLRLVEDFEAGDVADPTVAELVVYLDLKQDSGDDTAGLSKADLGDADTVKIMTVHGAKGLEWPVVYIAAASQADFGINAYREPIFPDALARSWSPRPDRDEFPTKAAYDRADSTWKKDFLARDTRRIAYVAATRAQDDLVLTWSADDLKRTRPTELHEMFAAVAQLADHVVAPEAVAPVGRIALESFVRGNLRLVNSIAGDLATGEVPARGVRLALEAAWEEAGGNPGDVATAMDLAGVRIGMLERDLAGIAQTEAALAEVSDAVEDGGRLRLSFSSLDAFQTCPHRYYLDKVVGLPRYPVNSAGDYGTAVHAAIQKHGEAASRGEGLDLDAIWPVAPKASGAGSDGVHRIDPKDGFEQSVDASARVLLSEEPFALRMHGCEVVGFIDRVQELPDGTVEVVDFKTHRDLPSEEIRNASLQIPIYLLALRDREAATGLRVRRGVLHYLRHAVRHEITRNDAQLDALRGQIESLAEEMRTVSPTDHRASPEHCGRCAFREVCAFAV